MSKRARQKIQAERHKKFDLANAYKKTKEYLRKGSKEKPSGGYWAGVAAGTIQAPVGGGATPQLPQPIPRSHLETRPPISLDRPRPVAEERFLGERFGQERASGEPEFIERLRRGAIDFDSLSDRDQATLLKMHHIAYQDKPVEEIARLVATGNARGSLEYLRNRKPWERK